MDTKLKAVLLLVLSAFSFALMSMFIKLAGDIPSIEKSLFRNLIACIIAFIIAKKNSSPLFGKKENRKALILRSLLGTLGIIANYYAIDHLILSDANILNKLSPFFMMITSYFLLKEKISLPQGFALGIAFLGSLFVIKPSFSSDMLPSLVGVASAVFAGSAYTYVRYLGNKERSHTIVFFFSFFSIVSTLPFVIIAFKPFGFIQFIYLILAGCTAAIAQFALTTAYKYAPSREISVYDYSQIIFSAALGFIVFGQIPDSMSIIGYILIIASGIGIFFYNKKQVVS